MDCACYLIIVGCAAQKALLMCQLDDDNIAKMEITQQMLL